MRGLLFIVMLFAAGAFFTLPQVASAQPPQQANNFQPFAPDRILVKFEPGLAASDIGKIHRQGGGRTLKVIPGINVHVVEVPAGSVLERVALYAANPNVEYAEPDYYRLLAIPSEEPGPTPAGDASFFEEQWYLNNVGQWHTSKRSTVFGETLSKTKGTNDADIDAPEAWDIVKGSLTTNLLDVSTPKIAVLDTGADCAALELSGKCLEQVNVVGPQLWDTGDGDAVGHGTFVASEAAADTNNGKGIAGVGWNSSFGAFKVCYLELLTDGINYFTAGVCPVSASAEGIVLAATNSDTRSQYHVITMSYASDLIDPVTGALTQTDASTAECAAIEYAWDHGVVIVAAAGNNGDTNKVYPAACTHSVTGDPMVISVGASDDADNRAAFSNYSNDSDDWVSIAAPGEWILGVMTDASCGTYDPGTDTCVDWWNGTSMATPLVAGAASLVWEQLYESGSVSDMTPENCMYDGRHCNEVVREHIESGADKFGAQGQNMLAWTRNGRLNIANALGNTQAVNQPPVASFTHSCTDLSCSFTDTSTDDGSNLSWSWNFGDGYSSSNQHPTHNYSASGTYNVSLTVTDSQGLSDTATVSVAVTSPSSGGNSPPLASFSYSCTGYDCTFDGSASSDPDAGGYVASWSWSFGDGAIDSGAVVSHTYTKRGSYDVVLTVADDQGAQGTATATVKASNKDTTGSSNGGSSGGGTGSGGKGSCKKTGSC